MWANMTQPDMIRDEAETGGLRAHKPHAEGLDCILEMINSHRIILSKKTRYQIFIWDRKLQVWGEVGIWE